MLLMISSFLYVDAQSPVYRIYGVLDVSSGIAVSDMSGATRKLLSPHRQGYIVSDNTEDKLYYHNGSVWENVASGGYLYDANINTSIDVGKGDSILFVASGAEFMKINGNNSSVSIGKSSTDNLKNFGVTAGNFATFWVSAIQVSETTSTGFRGVSIIGADVSNGRSGSINIGDIYGSEIKMFDPVQGLATLKGDTNRVFLSFFDPAGSGGDLIIDASEWKGTYTNDTSVDGLFSFRDDTWEIMMSDESNSSVDRLSIQADVSTERIFLTTTDNRDSLFTSEKGSEFTICHDTTFAGMDALYQLYIYNNADDPKFLIKDWTAGVDTNIMEITNAGQQIWWFYQTEEFVDSTNRKILSVDSNGAIHVNEGNIVYSEKFDAVASWGTASGGEYTITVTQATHGFEASYPITVDLQEDLGTEFGQVPITTAGDIKVEIVEASGNVNIIVSEAPDERFAGRIIIK